MLTCPSSRPVSGAPYHGYTGARSAQPPWGCARESSVLPASSRPRRRARAGRLPGAAASALLVLAFVLALGCRRGAAAGGRRLRAHPRVSRPGHLVRHVRLLAQHLEEPGSRRRQAGREDEGARRRHALPRDGQLPHARRIRDHLPARRRRPDHRAVPRAGHQGRRLVPAGIHEPGQGLGADQGGHRLPQRRRPEVRLVHPRHRSDHGQAGDAAHEAPDDALQEDPRQGRQHLSARRVHHVAGRDDHVRRAYWPGFPYAGLAAIYDVFVPMGYYTYHGDGYANAYRDTRDNIRIIREKTGLPSIPIHVIGGDAAKSSVQRDHGLRARPARERRSRRQPVRLGDDERGVLGAAGQRPLQPSPESRPAPRAAVRGAAWATAAPTARTPRRSSTRPPSRRATGCCASASSTCRSTRCASS